jgi:2-polyprenyl-3-methyl-5-hydroxy-6-metoxy-1,4-benzoquinol methylase
MYLLCLQLPGACSRIALSFNACSNIGGHTSGPFERLVAHVHDGSRVLDIGCGSGLLLSFMAGTGLEFEGVDIDMSPRAIEVATGMAHRVTKMKLKAPTAFMQLDVGAYWPDGTFDAVFSG